MKSGQKISREELEAQGWRQVTSFGLGIVFSKDKERILWLPKTNEVIIEYTKD